MPNSDMLRKVGDYIYENPDEYDQSDWVHGLGKTQFVYAEKPTMCGTAFCIAGATVFLHPDFCGFTRDGECVLMGPTFDEVVECYIRDVATYVLDLNPDDADALFYGSWRPIGYYDLPITEAVRDALYQIADGASVWEVSR